MPPASNVHVCAHPEGRVKLADKSPVYVWWTGMYARGKAYRLFDTVFCSLAAVIERCFRMWKRPKLKQCTHCTQICYLRCTWARESRNRPNLSSNFWIAELDYFRTLKWGWKLSKSIEALYCLLWSSIFLIMSLTICIVFGTLFLALFRLKIITNRLRPHSVEPSGPWKQDWRRLLEFLYYVTNVSRWDGQLIRNSKAHPYGKCRVIKVGSWLRIVILFKIVRT